MALVVIVLFLSRAFILSLLSSQTKQVREVGLPKASSTPTSVGSTRPWQAGLLQPDGLLVYETSAARSLGEDGRPVWGKKKKKDHLVSKKGVTFKENVTKKPSY